MSIYDFEKQPKLRDIVSALGDCVARAPEQEKAHLSNAIEAYATRFPQCYKRLRHDHALLAEIFAELEEASDARPGQHDQLSNAG